MEELSILFQKDTTLFSNTIIRNTVTDLKPFLKELCINALHYDLPTPCYLAALDYLNTLHDTYATANIIQAQRDFFGAHQYQKKGSPSDEFFHSSWE